MRFIAKLAAVAVLCLTVYTGYQNPAAVKKLITRAIDVYQNSMLRETVTGAMSPLSGSVLHIYALDIGQGDSLLIQSPGGKTILIDAGTLGSDTVQQLRAHNVKTIDLAIATHPHADHIGRMADVLKNFPVKTFLDSGRAYPSATYEKMLLAIKGSKTKFIKAQRGQVFEVEEGIKLEVLNPGKDHISKIRSGGSLENANSVMVRLVYGKFAMIFTGDAEFETEAELMKAGIPLEAQVLKIGHHGSRHATSGKFLSLVKPEAAIISDGADNDYGHPAQETLDWLKREGVTTYRTDLQGEIHVTTNGKIYRIETASQTSETLTWKGRSPKQQRSHYANQSSRSRHTFFLTYDRNSTPKPKLADKELTILIDCNDPETGKFRGKIVAFEVYDGEDQVMSLWDERAGLYSDTTCVRFKKDKVHFWEDVPGVSVPVIRRDKSVDAPCWERFVIRAGDLIKLLNWFSDNGNFSWESGSKGFEVCWEECFEGETLTEEDLVLLLEIA